MSGVLYIDKPSGISSFDVCFKLRKVLNTKRIGHTGTLDPNASGVMIVLFDDATKGAQFLVSDKKTYKTRVIFGIETDTLDVDGNIVKNEEYIVPDKKVIIDVLNSFLGQSKQVVPLTSAKKINGKKLYQYQLEGKDVELPVIDINIFKIELNEILEDGFVFTCEVSSGTYIRSLVRDILQKLGVIGTVKDLRRIMIDDVTIDQCDKLDDVLNGNYKKHNLLDVLEKRYKIYETDNIEDVKNGKPLSINSEEDYLIIVDSNRNLLAMYKKDNDIYRSARGLW